MKILSKFKEAYLMAVQKAVLAIYPQSQNVYTLITETPKRPEWGDIAIPLFLIVKEQGVAPQVLSAKVIEILQKENPKITISAMGAYLNIVLDKQSVTTEIMSELISKGLGFYQCNDLNDQNIMLEFSCPNTNKPLHLGHLRNDCLGESLSRVFKNCGAKVCKVNLINDRGVHICKSMIAYQKFGEGKTPESEDIKSDHFVGQYYVKFSNWAKEEPEAEKLTQKMLVDWEANDPEVMALWNKMNKWAIDGIYETYAKTDISFDTLYLESKTYKLGRDLILQGLEKGIFFKADDGSIRLDISELDNAPENEPSSKIFLRADGTSIYITQDVGTAVMRHEDFPFTKLIYVVGNEQQRHFQILFYALKKLGYSWADSLYHLAYGMVNLPDGKMKSREGTVVDADDLIKSLEDMARQEIASKESSKQVDKDAALKIAIAAIHYFLLQVSPGKDMSFDPKASLSFTGNTGPYLQYTLARTHSLLEKPEAQKALQQKFDPHYLTLDEEWQIIRLLDEVPETILQTAKEYAPNLLANKIYDVAKLFNKYYHDVAIISQNDLPIVTARCYLVQCVEMCLKTCLYLLNIPVVDHM